MEVHDPTSRRYRSRLATGPSTINGAGDGLFTMKRIREGKEICEYRGREVQGTATAGDSDWKAYIMSNHDDSVQICALDENAAILSLAGLINDCLNEERWNVTFQWRGRRCFVVANRDIEPGEELFGPYTGKYWKSGRYPLEITLEARRCYELRRNRADKEEWEAVIRYLQRVTMDLTFEDEVQVIEPPIQFHDVIDLTMDS